MSGGSYNYTCYTFQNEYEGCMYDEEMNDLVKDLFQVLHDLEWWQSADISEKTYRETLKNLKEKWFKQNRSDRLKNYINEKINKTRKELYNLIGLEEIN